MKIDLEVLLKNRQETVVANFIIIKSKLFNREMAPLSEEEFEFHFQEFKAMTDECLKNAQTDYKKDILFSELEITIHYLNHGFLDFEPFISSQASITCQLLANRCIDYINEMTGNVEKNKNEIIINEKEIRTKSVENFNQQQVARLIDVFITSGLIAEKIPRNKVALIFSYLTGYKYSFMKNSIYGDELNDLRTNEKLNSECIDKLELFKSRLDKGI